MITRIALAATFRRAAKNQIVSACMLLALATTARAATLYVDQSATEASNNRFASIAQAMTRLQAGDTLVIADGIYRESIDLRQKQLPANAQASTRIEAAPNAHPIIKGSDVVDGWQRLMGDVYTKKQWQANSQQVYIDGKPLQQIGGVIFGGFPLDPKHAFAKMHQSHGGIWPGRSGSGVADLVDESFYYDHEAKILYVKTALDIARAHLVEVSTRPHLVIGTEVNRLEIRGLKFAHANTTAVSQSGAIALVGNRLVLDNVTIEYADGAGIDVTGNDNTVSRSTANYCGTVGLKVRGNNARVIDNETSFNNTRGFNKWWEAGGAKFVGAGGLQNSEVSGHRAYANNGDGLWFDWHNDNNRIHDNIAAFNTGMGIHYEASHKAFVYDNYVVGNAQRGIYLPNSSDSVLAHNLVAANGMEGIAIVDERHAAKNGVDNLVPRNNRVIGNVVAWNGKASLVLPLDTSNRSNGNVFLDLQGPTLSLGWPSRERPLVQGLSTWQTQTGHDGNSWSQQASLPPAIQAQVDARQPLTAATLREWQSLLATTSNLRTPAMADVDTKLSRPGAAPGPIQGRTIAPKRGASAS